MQSLNEWKLSPVARRILTEIYRHPGSTRQDIAAFTGLSQRSTITHVLELLDGGLVVVQEMRTSTGGRRSEGLAINPALFTVLGVDIGGHAMKLGVMKPNGEVVHSRTVTKAMCEQLDPLDADLLVRELQQTIREAGASPVGVGIGISGFVEHERGLIRYCPNVMGLQNVDVTRDIGKKLGLPVYVDSSARTLAMAERRFGGHAHGENMLYISAGRGISAGILVEGKVFRGSSGFAGELGHIKVPGVTEMCSCGSRGCLELVATLPIITKEISDRAVGFYGYTPLMETAKERKLTPQDVQEGLRRGDKIAAEVMDEAGRALGSAVAGYVSAFDPGLVVFGGSVAEFYPRVIREAMRTVETQCVSTVGSGIQMEISRLDHIRASIQGAGMLAADAMFAV